MRRFVEIGLVLLASVLGCDKPKAQTIVANAPAPTTAPAPSASIAVTPPPTTEPIEAADTTPPSCIMAIEHQPVEFPQAMLRFHRDGGHLVALLYSDDPKDALNNNYRGNGFYFQLKLDDGTSPNFDTATWIYHSQNSDRIDTPYGIFLDGHRRQLQPQDVRIRLLPSATDNAMLVEIAGTFLSVDPQDSLASTQVVDVSARVLSQKQ